MDNEARREMEQRALRNVRGLVDKIEQDDKVERRSQRRIVVGIVVGAIIVAAILATMLVRGDKARREAVISAPAPVQPAR